MSYIDDLNAKKKLKQEDADKKKTEFLLRSIDGNIKSNSALDKLADALTSVSKVTGPRGPKGAPGKDGKTPVKGKDYFTKEEIAIIAEDIEGRIRIPEDGKTPIKGVDYFTPEEIRGMIANIIARIPMPKDGKDGKDASIDYDKLIKDVVKRIPKPKDGKDGRDGVNTFVTAPGKNPYATVGYRGEVKLTEGDQNPGYLLDKLIAGSNITLTPSESGVTISASGGGSGGGAVDSVNGQTGEVTLDADDIDDTSTAHKFVTSDDLTTLSNTSGTNTGDQDLSGYAETADLAAVATSGDYDDLTNKPSIPTQYTDEMAQDAVGGILADSSEIDFTYNDSTPSVTASLKAGSIDESKLDTSVNASLDLADSATQPGDNVSTLTNDSGFLSSVQDGNIDSETATDGYVLTADGSGGAAWEAVAGSGTVTSVAVSGSDGIEVDSGSPITGAGTIALGVNKTSLLSHINVEDGADVTDATNVAAAGAVMNSDTSTASMSFVVDEDDMTSDSNTKVPTQQSVKAYVDANSGGSGDVEGPASSTDNAIAVFDGTTGKIIKNSSVTIDTSGGIFDGNVTIPGSIYSGSIYAIGNEILADYTYTDVVYTDQVLEKTSDAGITVDGVLIKDGEVDGLDIGSITATEAEINVLDGITATTAELNYTDGVTSAIQTQLDGKITGFADPNADRIVFWDDSAGAYAALTASTGLSISGTNMTVRTSSASQTGIVELATTAETQTGTDATRAVTPDGLNDMTSLSNKAWFLDEDDMASSDATKVASQQSIKAYVDAGVAKGNHSTTEVDTGTTWHDGKTIYRKVYTGVTVTANSTVNTAHGLSIDNVVQCYGTLAGGSSIPLHASATNYYSIRGDKTNITIFTGSGASSTTATVTIEYTKT